MWNCLQRAIQWPVASLADWFHSGFKVIMEYLVAQSSFIVMTVATFVTFCIVHYQEPREAALGPFVYLTTWTVIQWTAFTALWTYSCSQLNCATSLVTNVDGAAEEVPDSPRRRLVRRRSSRAIVSGSPDAHELIGRLLILFCQQAVLVSFVYYGLIHNHPKSMQGIWAEMIEGGHPVFLYKHVQHAAPALISLFMLNFVNPRVVKHLPNMQQIVADGISGLFLYAIILHGNALITHEYPYAFMNGWSASSFMVLYGGTLVVGTGLGYLFSELLRGRTQLPSM